MIWLHAGAGNLQALSPETQEGMRQTEKVFTTFGQALYVTHMQAGIHSDGSMHPYNRAFDCNYPKLMFLKKFKKALDKKLNPNRDKGEILYDIVYHKNHIHVEYDPK